MKEFRNRVLGQSFSQAVRHICEGPSDDQTHIKVTHFVYNLHHQPQTKASAKGPTQSLVEHDTVKRKKKKRQKVQA